MFRYCFLPNKRMMLMFRYCVATLLVMTLHLVSVVRCHNPSSIRSSINDVDVSVLSSSSASFERWSHFHDYGVPAVLASNDTLNQAMIADGTCRLGRTSMSTSWDGFAFYRDAERTAHVLNAYQQIRSSSATPSAFTLDAQERFESACVKKSARVQSNRQCDQISLSSLTGSLDAWHRALCATKDDPAWGGVFDPAYMPQQMALTTGFVCIVSCDCGNDNTTTLTSETMRSFAVNERAAVNARDRLCDTVPFGSVNFTRDATSVDELTSLTSSLRRGLCACGDF